MIRKSSTFVKSQNSFAGLLHRHEESKPKFNLQLFRQNLFILKFNSWVGTAWDAFQVVLSLVACAVYVAETYFFTFRAVKVYGFVENVITQFFLIDFLLSWFLSTSTRHFFRQFMTWIDIVTILPVYIGYVVSDDAAPNLSILRFLRILRLIRILRTFQMLGGFSGVKRQSITLSLAMLSLIFLAAGVLNILENEFNALSYDCQYINSLTLYEPSCEPGYPTYDDPTCDCKDHQCEPLYQSSDPNHMPSKIKCTDLSFFNSLYFIIITIYPVGYGSMIVNNYSRLAIIIVIIASIIVIQMQVNKLSQLYSMISPYRAPYIKNFQDKHVVLCGFVHDKEKLRCFLREFFHPDRQSPRLPGFHLVVLGPVEPSPDLVDLLSSPLFEGRLFYIMGSALVTQDLVKARVDTAAAIMFLSNPELDRIGTVLDDAATVLKTMSVLNFNPDIECLVQVLRASDRDLLKDGDADIVLCMDDYKTTMQARNAMCPGLSTFVENIFHSFGSGRNSILRPTDLWISEYKYGLQMELYYVRIHQDFFEKLHYNWRLLVEAVYLEYECILLGVCRASDQSLCLNPGKAEFQKLETADAFFKSYTTGVLLAPDDASANAIAYALTDAQLTENMLDHLISAEDDFAVRAKVLSPTATKSKDKDRRHSSSVGTSTIRRMSQTINLGVRSITEILKTNNALDPIIEVQNVLDTEFSPDLSQKKNNKKKKRNSVHDSGSSDDMEDDDFLGFVENESDETDIFDSESSSFKKQDASNDALTVSTIGQSKNNPKVKPNALKIFAKKIVKGNSKAKQSAWLNVIRALNIHGEEEVVDDASSLRLLQSRGRSTTKARGGSTNTKLSTFTGAARIVMALSSAPTPSPVKPTRKNKPSLKGASKKLVKMGVLFNTSKAVAGVTKDIKDDGKLSLKRLGLSQRMEGFRKKQMSSSFGDSNSESSSRTSYRGSVSPVDFLNVDDDDDEVEENQFEKKGFSQTCLPDEESTFFLAKGPKKLAINDAPNGGRFDTVSEFKSADSMESPLKTKVFDTKKLKESVQKIQSLSNTKKQRPPQVLQHGQLSTEVLNADSLREHIIVMGCLDSVELFVKELRKPFQNELSYHSVLIVADFPPSSWKSIQNHHDDVFFLQTRSKFSGEQELTLMNIKFAHSLVLLASRDRNSVDEATNIDSAAIFTYLKLHAFVPRHVFFTVELFLASSIGMLNSVIMRHLKNSEDEISMARRNSRISTGIAVSRKRRKSSVKVSGSVDTALMFEDFSMMALTETDTGIASSQSLSHRDSMINKMEAKKSRFFQSGHPKTIDESTSFRRPAVMLPSGDSCGNLLLKEDVVAKSKYADEINTEEKFKLEEKDQMSQASLFWDTEGTHHVLPVYAASMAYVPTGFDSIFCNSFFGTFTPQMCEKLICGQEHQTMHNIEVPRSFWDRHFGDLFRAMNSRGVLPVALYRREHGKNDASMSYVYTNPCLDTMLSESDRVLAFGSSDIVKKVIDAISLPLARQPGTTGKFSLNLNSLKNLNPAESGNGVVNAADFAKTLKAAALKYGGNSSKVHP